MIALAAIGVLAIAGIALAARGGEDEKATGTDLTAIRCPLAPTGETVGGAERYEPAKGAFDTAELIGMSLEQARAKAAEHTCEVVVSLEDGRGVPVPIDVDPKRIYVYTEDGVVTEIEGVGGGI
jgi:hypothetical protein